MEMTEALMYTDDSICIKYTDGSTLQLSPCGSVFSYQGITERPDVIQLTRFAISVYKEKVCHAVLLRNQFACRPYLCKEVVLQKQLMISYEAVEKCVWPLNENLKDFVQKLPGDAAVQVQSVDGFAVLVLMAHKQTFVVSFLAEVPQGVTPSQRKQTSPLTSGQKNLYTWVKQVHSVKHSPECWRYPLELALSYNKNNSVVSNSADINHVTKLPLPLPLNCRNVHLHSWKAQVINKECNKEIYWQPNLKMLWRNGTTYRVYRDKLCGIEVMVKDGSFICSQGSSGKFFTHFFVSSDAQVEERVYSSTKPPPEKPGQTFSLAQVVISAGRILEFLSKVGGGFLPVSSCWNRISLSSTEKVSSPPSELVESCSVTNLGNFFAFSTGHIRITFADRTILSTLPPKSSKTIQFGRFQDFTVCQLILPNGSVEIVPLSTSGEFERYTRFVVEWLDWLKCSPENRRTFCEGTVWDADCQRTAQEEIEKIQRFNYIVENCASSKILSLSNIQGPFFKDKTDYFQMQGGLAKSDGRISVHDALTHTAQAIQEIDSLLSAKEELSCTWSA